MASRQTPAVPVRCENSWCTTRTGAHKSNFAKKKCDQQRALRAFPMLLPSSMMPTPAMNKDDEADLFAPDDENSSTRVMAYEALVGAELDGSVIEHCVLSGAARTSARGVILKDVSIQGGMSDCVLDDSSANVISLSSTIKSTSMVDAKLVGLTVKDDTVLDDVSMPGARLNDSVWGQRVVVRDSSLRWAKARRSEFGRGAFFTNCDLTGFDISGSKISGQPEGQPFLSRCEIDMMDFSGIDLSDAHFSDIEYGQRIFFVDDYTLPQLEPGSLELTDAGREFMTRAMTAEQFSEYTDLLGVPELEVRAASARLSPALVPVYEDGRCGDRGDLLRRAILGEDINVLVSIQAEVWSSSADNNPLLVRDPSLLYS